MNTLRFASIFVLLSVAATRAMPADGPDSINDVLNEIVPISPSSPGPAPVVVSNKPAVPISNTSPGSSTVAPISTTRPRPSNTTTRPNYFSQVITGIFEIPIAVLSAVRNLINATAGRNLNNTRTA